MKALGAWALDGQQKILGVGQGGMPCCVTDGVCCDVVKHRALFRVLMLIVTRGGDGI